MFLLLSSPQGSELWANIIKILKTLLKKHGESDSKPDLELLNYGAALMLPADISFSRKTYLEKK